MPESLRETLGTPLGRLFTDEELQSPSFKAVLGEEFMVITVGDRVTETVAELGRTPDLQVVDGRERRQDRRTPDVKYRSMVKVRNPAGTISDEAVKGISKALANDTKPSRVLVDGEEDLLVIPAVALAPGGTHVFYGQPLQGVVLVEVDAAARMRNQALLREIGIDVSESS